MCFIVSVLLYHCVFLFFLKETKVCGLELVRARCGGEVAVTPCGSAQCMMVSDQHAHCALQIVFSHYDAGD